MDKFFVGTKLPIMVQYNDITKSICFQLLNTLKLQHEEGHTHLNIKPSNVLIQSDRRVLLSDPCDLNENNTEMFKKDALDIGICLFEWFIKSKLLT
jgi:serine/threonine protein kinase